MQRLSRVRATYFSLLARKKSRQKKAPSPTEQTRSFVAAGIFRFAILGESKNGGRPVRRPMGLESLREFFVIEIENDQCDTETSLMRMSAFTMNDPILMLCAAHSLALALFHIGFWKIFRWPKTLQQSTVANRAILQIANIQLIWLFLAVAALCLVYPAELRGTALGRAVLMGMSGFWIVRLIQQFVFLRINYPMVHALSAVFALGAALFAWPLFQQ